MTIDNDFIAGQFSLLAKLMDIHEENTFKIRSYTSAAFAIEKLPESLLDIAPSKYTAIKGIGDAIGKKIQEIIQTGELRLLTQYIANTPPGILEMLSIKGLGPKKITTIWKDMGIESIGELLYACQENRLLLYKGFGEKTQANVRATLEFYLKSQGSHLYADLESYAHSLQDRLQKHFSSDSISLTGAFRRRLETIDQLELVTTVSPADLGAFLATAGFTLQPPTTAPAPGPTASATGPAPSATGQDTSTISQGKPSTSQAALTTNQAAPATARTQYQDAEGIRLDFIHTSPAQFAATLFTSSCSGEFLTAWQQVAPTFTLDSNTSYADEEAIFSAASIHYIPPYQREQTAILDAARHAPLQATISVEDIRAIIHSHSNWSDGSNTLEEMAAACIAKGYEYLVISDHSKSAFYANGLKEDRIVAQHQLIDELNQKLAPFTIFKSIECDILNDGALDYTDDILATFDLVIASVHSTLKMTEEKAMSRLLRAIENPFTTILGHMTGRLLLSRPGYPVDHKKIIDACAANQVAIELNAHPRRLDIDWRWIPYALDKGVRLSIDPDAHSISGYDDVKYGVLAAQKGGLTAKDNLSSLTRDQFRDYLGIQQS